MQRMSQLPPPHKRQRSMLSDASHADEQDVARALALLPELPVFAAAPQVASRQGLPLPPPRARQPVLTQFIPVSGAALPASYPTLFRPKPRYALPNGLYADVSPSRLHHSTGKENTGEAVHQSCQPGT